MREIKFRAWDKRNKRFVCFELFKGINNHTPEIYTKGNYLKDDFEEWKQYTGLKDKNGKEIYEGDWVKELVGHQKIHKIVWDEYECRFEALFKEYSDQWLKRHIVDLKNMEVVGNIYENPELLN